MSEAATIDELKAQDQLDNRLDQVEREMLDAGAPTEDFDTLIAVVALAAAFTPARTAEGRRFFVNSYSEGYATSGIL